MNMTQNIPRAYCHADSFGCFYPLGRDIFGGQAQAQYETRPATPYKPLPAARATVVVGAPYNS